MLEQDHSTKDGPYLMQKVLTLTLRYGLRYNYT